MKAVAVAAAALWTALVAGFGFSLFSPFCSVGAEMVQAGTAVVAAVEVAQA